MIKSDINNAEIVLMSLNKTRSLIVVGSGPEKEGFDRKI